jgi:drug/metabolite transporter (DMT)-like permease
MSTDASRGRLHLGSFLLLLGLAVCWGYNWVVMKIGLQQRIDAGMLSLIVLIVPLVGIAAGWAQLGERPSGSDAIGMTLILAAIAGMVLSQRRKAPAPIVCD